MKNTLFLLSLAFFAVDIADAATFGPISVQEIPLTDATERTQHGYVEYRFRITNRDGKAHHVALELPQSSYRTYGAALGSVAGAIEVPPHSTAVMRVLQPPLKLNGNADVRVAIDGRYQRNADMFRKVQHMEDHRSGNPEAQVLTGLDVPAELRDLFRIGVPKEETRRLEGETEMTAPAATAALTPTVSGAPTPPEVIASRAQVPLAEWSDNWLAYSRFDAVVLTSGEWRELQERHPGIFAAVRKYVEAGGMLCILGGNDWTPPKEWVKISAKTYAALLGEVFVTSGSVDAIKPDIEPFREIVLERARSWQGAIGRIGYGGGIGGGVMSGDTKLFETMPVVENYGVNVKLIMVLIVCFAVLIGPVNIYVLSRMKRRIWLLWTVPVTSLAASLLVLGVSFFQEGLLRQASSSTFTLLDQRREEAVTFGFVGYYATLTPGGLAFSPDTEVTACMERDYRNNRSLEMRLMGGGNQFFTRGWISARVPSYFAVRKAQSQQKLRVAFDWSGDKPSATNGLGVDIKTLRVRSPEGKLFSAQNIKAGDKVELVAATEAHDQNGVKTKAAHAGEWSVSETQSAEFLHTNYDSIMFEGQSRFPLLLNTDTLPNGSYLAEIDAWNPFLEPGIERMKPYQVSTTVLGYFE